MKINKKFIVHGGDVISENDGDLHYISEEKVAKLFRLDPDQWSNTTVGVNYNYITIGPDPTGRYNLANEIDNQIEKVWLPLERERCEKKFILKVGNMSFFDRLKFLVHGKKNDF